MNPPSQLHARIQAKKVLFGCAIESPAPGTAELAATMGYDIIWIDMEHHGVNWLEVQALFQGAKLGGALTLLRVASPARPDILGGLDRGADMIMVPMVESVETAKQMVDYGKFKPMGNRGFVGSSRGMGYGLAGPVPTMERCNRETHLFVQIETMLGVERCHEIFAVDGISGVVIGPADLSISYGKPLAFDDPGYLEVFSRVIKAATSLGKIAIIPGGHPAVVKAGLKAGAQAFVTTGERGALKAAWAQNLKDNQAIIAQAGG